MEMFMPPSYGVNISQVIHFVSVCSTASDFNNRNQILSVKLLKQGYGYHKIRKVYQRHSKLIVKYNNIDLKTLMQQGVSEPVFLW